MEKLANHQQNRATKAGVPKKSNMKPRKKTAVTKMDGQLLSGMRKVDV